MTCKKWFWQYDSFTDNEAFFRLYKNIMWRWIDLLPSCRFTMHDKHIKDVKKGTSMEMQHKIKIMQCDQYVYWHINDDYSNGLKYIFYTNSYVITLLNILLINSAYKTNKYISSLVKVIGVTSTKMMLSNICLCNLSVREVKMTISTQYTSHILEGRTCLSLPAPNPFEQGHVWISSLFGLIILELIGRHFSSKKC